MIMNLKAFIFFSFQLLILACTSQKNSEEQIIVFCAASLSTVVDEAKDEWEKEHNEKVIINAASSGTLARQIEFGAQADIFLSANQDWMDYIIKVASPANEPITIATNKLAVVTPKDPKPDSVPSENYPEVLLTNNDKIAVGDPGHVPLGRYTRESLEFYGISQDVSPRLILTKDARSTLRLVELGEAGFGIIYQTDAVNSDKVRVVAIIDEQSHRKIEYEAVLLVKNQGAAGEFLEYLTSAKSNKIWAGNGFIR
jgi:molybdate transport system substrate-binding protein